MMNKIDRLTAEQEALIPVYKKKWQDIAFSTKQIDKEKISVAIKQVYSLINKPEPIIAFSVYSNSEEEILFSEDFKSFGLNFDFYFRDLIRNQIYDLAIEKLDSFLLTKLENYRLNITSIWDLLFNISKLARKDYLKISNLIQRYLPRYQNNCELVKYGIFVDFCSNILDVNLNSSI